jgi:hypothetical protein
MTTKELINCSLRAGLELVVMLFETDSKTAEAECPHHNALVILDDFEAPASQVSPADDTNCACT